MNDRENDYQWAGPYLYSRQVIAVASDSDIQTFDDLLGKNVEYRIRQEQLNSFSYDRLCIAGSKAGELLCDNGRYVCSTSQKDMSMRLQDMKLC